MQGSISRTLELEVGAFMRPHPAKAARGGEDACFLLDHDVGVFDGVGGWALRGQDPGVYTRGFAEAVAENITAQRLEDTIAANQSLQSDPDGQQRAIRRSVDLQQALENGVQKAPGQGSCTACVVTFDPIYGMLSGANIGDSGALLIRRDVRGSFFVALKTATQRHRFNQPFQLGTDSPDKPWDAQPFFFYVREGDIIILATDGLLDNMYDEDIIECLSHSLAPKMEEVNGDEYPRSIPSSSAIARSLVQRAFELALDKERVTPWEEEAVAAGIVPRRGCEGIRSSQQPRGWSWDAATWGPALRRFSQGRFGRPYQSGSRLDDDDDDDDGRVEDDEEASKAGKEGVTFFRGGKVDDITVVVAAVARATMKAIHTSQKASPTRGPTAADVGSMQADDDTQR